MKVINNFILIFLSATWLPLGLFWDTAEGQSHPLITVYLFEFTFNSKVIRNFKERIKNQFQHKKCFETLTLQFSLNNSKTTFFSYKIFKLESFLNVKPQFMKVIVGFASSALLCLKKSRVVNIIFFFMNWFYYGLIILIK